ncbi:MAG: class I SAM-dependent methyltransferase [Thermomicrobiales bacterium]|nr:class I SAM-dependent methyltransferase [Thermomicrobiales bacterium]
MSNTTLEHIDWKHWLDRWDAQQTGYLPDREDRFTMMFDVLEQLLPPNFTAIDLACGPGSISQRILQRFPQARCIAVDYDPLLLLMGRSVLGDGGGRLSWVEANLSSPEWVAGLGTDRVDAVLSTTALHWLTAPELVRVYSELGSLIRPGGVFLNGDNMSFAAQLPVLRKLGETRRALDMQSAFELNGQEDWDTWWNALRAEPGLSPVLNERTRRFAVHDTRKHVEQPPAFDLHVAGLQAAGFSEVGTIWQRYDNRILLAVR